jgi:hypothetical protein
MSFNPYTPCVTPDDFMRALFEQQQIWELENHPSGMRLQWLKGFFAAYEMMQRNAVGTPLPVKPCDPAKFRTILGEIMDMPDNYSIYNIPFAILHTSIYPAQGFTDFRYTEEQLAELVGVVLHLLDRIKINPAAFVPPPVQVIDRQLTNSIDALLGEVHGSIGSGGQIVKAFADGIDAYESPDGMLARKEMADLSRAMCNSMEVDDYDLQAAILASMKEHDPME